MIESNLFEDYPLLTRLSRHSSTPTTTEATDVLRRVRASFEIQALLEQILSSRERLQEVAQRSYRHPNGFARIVLWKDGDFGAKVRLHVWTDNDVPSSGNRGNIHNH
ncbi:MAG: hypothetical protein ACHBNF_07920 [Chromatiales bacterium]